MALLEIPENNACEEMQEIIIISHKWKATRLSAEMP